MPQPKSTPAKKLNVEPAVFPVGGRGEFGDRTGPTARVEERDTEPGERQPIVPDGYKSEEEFLNYWIKQYTLDAEADKHNRDEAEEDLRFIYVDQWDEETRQEREDAGRPCLTVNSASQFIGQVVGDRRLNKTSFKVIPDRAERREVALTRAGLMRSIESFSDAERVYDMCCEDQVGCGISNFEVTMEYARNDVFEMDLFIRTLSNPFAVTWDRMSRDPTGKDARHCFVEETWPTDVFEDEFPDIPIATGFPGGVEGADWGSWCNADGAKVVALWIMVEKPATFALMSDGQVEDVTGIPEEQYAYRLHYEKGPDGKLIGYVKEGVRTYAQRWLFTGFAILEGPYELPLSRVPIIKVSGRVGRVGTKQYRFGLMRWARDPFLMRNYWRSVAIETLAMAPKAQFIASAASVKGREDDFRAAHLSGDPLLIYNTGKDKPDRVQQPELPAAVLNEAAMNTQDIKDVTGLQDASLGIRSNEVSGKAIMARQREGDVATITYHDHLNLAIQEAGRVLNDLIPICYDTTRTIKVMGVDDEVKHVTINDPADAASPDITQGRYDVKVITGPSFTTQRQEASELYLEMTKVMPEIMSQAADITVETFDTPGAERLAARFRKLIPIAQQEEQERQAEEAAASGQPVPTSPEQQAQAQQQQIAEQLAAKQLEQQEMMFQAQMAEQVAKTREAEARADKMEQDAIKAKEDARAAQANADRAEYLAEQADDDVVLNAHDRVNRIRRDDTPEPSGEQQQSGKTPSRRRKAKQ